MSVRLRPARPLAVALAATSAALLVVVAAGCGGGGAEPVGRILMVGIDSADWDVIEPLMAEG